MKEIRGNLFSPRGSVDAICFTTNGMVKRDGSCVMGRGCAARAKTRWPGIEHVLGSKITGLDNHVHLLTEFQPVCLFLPIDKVNFDYKTVPLDYHIVSFPVKHHWRDQADLDLIKMSASELMLLVDGLKWRKVVIPRPGCGNGRLTWKTVKTALEPLLDDRVHVIHFPSKYPQKAPSQRTKKTRN